MYTDTVQTFVILGGAFILMGYGMSLGGEGHRGHVLKGFHSGSWDIPCFRHVGRREGLGGAPGPLTILPTQLSTRWAGIRGFSTNTWGQ